MGFHDQVDQAKPHSILLLRGLPLHLENSPMDPAIVSRGIRKRASRLAPPVSSARG